MVGRPEISSTPYRRITGVAAVVGDPGSKVEDFDGPGPGTATRGGPEGGSVFIIVVALLFVITIGIVNFTDFVDHGVPALRTALAQRRQRTGPRH